MSVKSGKLDASTTVVLDRQTAERKSKKQGQSSGSRASSKMSSRLRYQDFLPTAAGKPAGSHPVETFIHLVGKANDWLRKNAHWKVKHCESVTWMSHDPGSLGDNEQMMLSKQVNPTPVTHYCRGLRLWLIPGSPRSAQSISCKDFLPEKQTDTVQDLVEKVNTKFGHSACKDEILSIQTVIAPLVDGARIDNAVTQWVNMGEADFPYTFILRVYYIKQAREKALGSNGCQIGIKDVSPRLVEDSYEGFDALLDQINNWVKGQTEVIIVNIQSVTVQANSGSPQDPGSLLYFTLPGAVSDCQAEFLRILRLVYITPLGASPRSKPAPPSPINFQTFVPQIMSGRNLGAEGEEAKEDGSPKNVGGNEGSRTETMRETFARVHAHLKTSGCELLCAETVYNPLEFYTDEKSSDLLREDQIAFLFTIRTYWTKDSKADSDMRRISITSKSRNSPNHAAAHPGPIFLRSVVTRRYKYRWLAVGLFAGTCMGIIVILSVIYSNR